MNILLIEPDVLLAATYASVLKKAGYRVRIATSAQSALDAADDMLPDIILLELQLVSHSGIEFLYEFRSYAEWQSVPVIVLSNVPPAEFKQSGSVLQDQLGVVDYYYKPHVSLLKLLRIVETAAVKM